MGSNSTIPPAEESPTSPGTHTSPTKSNTIITLQVGERRFTTLEDTLTNGSHYFKARFSSNWTPDVQSDGSYFLDADGDIFAHILRYLRSKIYPLLYDGSKGFDFATYASIQQLADFLIIPLLVNWIDKKHYLHAVKWVRLAHIYDDIDSIDDVTTAHKRTTHYPTWSSRDVYVCPRGIYIHRGKKERCGKDCAKALGGREDRFEEEKYVEKVLEVSEQVEFHEEVCREEDGQVSSIGLVL